MTGIDLVDPNTIKKLFFSHRAHKTAANLSRFKSETGEEERERPASSPLEKPLTLKSTTLDTFLRHSLAFCG